MASHSGGIRRRKSFGRNALRPYNFSYFNFSYFFAGYFADTPWRVPTGIGKACLWNLLAAVR